METTQWPRRVEGAEKELGLGSLSAAAVASQRWGEGKLRGRQGGSTTVEVKPEP